MWRQNLKRGCIIASLGRALRDSPVLAAAALAFFPGFDLVTDFFSAFAVRFVSGAVLFGFVFTCSGSQLIGYARLLLFSYALAMPLGSRQKQVIGSLRSRGRKSKPPISNSCSL